MKTLFKSYACGACELDVTKYTIDKYGGIVLEEVRKFNCPYCGTLIRTPWSESELRGIWWKIMSELEEDNQENREKVRMMHSHAKSRGWQLETSRARTRMVYWDMV